MYSFSAADVRPALEWNPATGTWGSREAPAWASKGRLKPRLPAPVSSVVDAFLVAEDEQPSCQSAFRYSCIRWVRQSPEENVLGRSSLPVAILQDIFMHVPLDERLLLVLVCTAWRRALEEPLLWATADVSCVRLDFKDTFLRAVAAKSRGAMTSLDVSNSVCEFIYGDHPVTMTRDALWEVLRASPQLRHLRVYSPSDEGVRFDNITALVSATPSLRVLEADIECSDDEACLVLRGEPPFGVLRLRRLCVNGMNPEDAAVLTFTSALEGSAAPLSELHVIVLPDTDVGLDALVNALVMTRMSSLIVGSVQQPPAFDATPYFVRLLKEGHPTALNVSSSPGHSHDYPPDWIDSLTLSFAFCEALRGSNSRALLFVDSTPCGMIFLASMIFLTASSAMHTFSAFQ